MPHTRTASGTSFTTYSTSQVVRQQRKYFWPAFQLNLWIILTLLSASAVLGILGNFTAINNQMDLGIPWYFPYFMTVASLTIIYVLSIYFLIYRGRLFPAVVMIGAFFLFVMWIVGLVRVSIALWGSGQVSGQCSISVWSQNPKGENLNTLAWLMQKSICQGWQALFSFALVGTALLIWIMIMAYQVFADS